MRLAIILICMSFLTACAEQPPKTLDERLAGKTSEEKQKILRLECLNEAESVGNSPHKWMYPRYYQNRDTAQTHRLKNICREIMDNYQRDEFSNNSGEKQ